VAACGGPSDGPAGAGPGAPDGAATTGSSGGTISGDAADAHSAAEGGSREAAASEAGSGSGARDAGFPDATPPPACATDITAQVLANMSITLQGDSCIELPAGTTQYDGVLSGFGTVILQAPNGAATLVVTADSTFSLPSGEQTETAVKTGNYYVIQNANRPAVFVEANVTLQLGTAASDAGSIASYLPNTGTSIINGDNIQVDGTLSMGGGPTEYFGVLSGAGTVVQGLGNPGTYATGTFFLVGDDPFSGVLSIRSGGYVGDLNIGFSMPFAQLIFNNGSMIMNSPPPLGYTLPQTVYEDHYGDDINTDHGLVTFAGVYSYSDSGDRIHPSLGDPSLDTMVVNNTAASPVNVNGTNASFRGINLEGGTTQWGDGTTSAFFLPSTPAPADPNAKNVKNAYINLHAGSTLVFNYNGRYTCNVGITGGGGGPDATGATGVGNLTIAPTANNYAVLTMPQNYHGTTTIGAGATLQLGNGAPVQAMAASVGAASAAAPRGSVTTSLLASYSGDSSLLIGGSDAGIADAIVDDGTLVVDNTTTAITLGNIGGIGGFVQMGTTTTTLLADGYSGPTLIQGGMLLVGSATSLGTGSVSNDAALGTAAGQHLIQVGGDYVQSSGATLSLGLGGTTQGSTYDSVAIMGKGTLGGTLVIQAASGFTPAVGQVFTVVQAAAGITGTFQAVTSPAIPLALSYDATHCFATVTP
jgi:hypothetical protein